MLSRTADHLLWMSRYIERAENTARMLDVNYQTTLLPQSAFQAEQGWTGLLSICELLPAYRRPTHDAASEYRLFVDPDNGPDREDSAPAPDHDPQRQGYLTYLRLVRGGGLSRRAALTEVCARFSFADEAAALAALRAEREAVIRRWQQSAPCMVQTLCDERWRGLLPED